MEDLLQTDLRSATVVILYLLPEALEKVVKMQFL